VNVWDFVRLELIRDLTPTLYGSVFRNPEYFWDRGLAFEYWSGGPQPFDEDKARKWRADRYQQIEASVPADKGEALDLLADLFPNFASYRQGSKKVENPTDADKNKRIFHPRHFWQYFLLKVPSALFPQKEFNNFLASVRNSDQDSTAEAYTKQFRSIVTEEFKRWYFIHLIENRFDDFGLEAEKGLCLGMARNSERWSSDAFELGTAVTCTHHTLGKINNAKERTEFLKAIARASSSDLYSLILYWRLRKLEEDGSRKLLTDIDEIRPTLEEQLRAHYLGSNRPSVFEQYGSLSSQANAIEPNQFLFSWQALSEKAKADAREYLTDLLTTNPKALDAFLRLMFRLDFINDYETLKPLIDYGELSELLKRYESKLDPEKVRQFKQRYETDQPPIAEVS
jgi:hypothetical protein